MINIAYVHVVLLSFFYISLVMMIFITSSLCYY